jgi:hypothetical protein
MHPALDADGFCIRCRQCASVLRGVGMYKSESAFYKALHRVVSKEKGVMMQRIETGTTGVGVPDLYIVTPQGCVWVELKNAPRYSADYSSASGYYKIAWRPGQQVWMASHYRISGRLCYTMCAVSNGVLLIPMVRIYDKNMVPYSDALRCESVKGAWALLRGLIR